MTSAFLLDPRYLDDSVEGLLAATIRAEALAYFKNGENGQPSYVFYVDSVKRCDPQDLTKIIPFTIHNGGHGDLSLHFRRANIIFMPISDGDRYQWGATNRGLREDYIQACEALYVRGEFLKGDAGGFKKYGVTKILDFP